MLLWTVRTRTTVPASLSTSLTDTRNMRIFHPWRETYPILLTSPQVRSRSDWSYLMMLLELCLNSGAKSQLRYRASNANSTSAEQTGEGGNHQVFNVGTVALKMLDTIISREGTQSPARSHDQVAETRSVRILFSHSCVPFVPFYITFYALPILVRKCIFQV